MQKSPSAVFIGQSPIDIIASVDDTFLDEYGIIKHSTKVISSQQSKEILDLLGAVQRLPGGGAANSSCAFSELHGMAIFNGKIANDDEGRLFLNSLTERGVNYANSLFDGGRGSDLIYTLITPDNERSFAACYEISSSMKLDELNIDCLQGADAVFLEGFLFNIEGGFETILAAAKMIKNDSNETLITFSPCDPQVIENYGAQVRELIEHIDILVMNEHEAAALYPGKTIEEIVDICRDKFTYGAITLGPNGSYGFSKEEIVRIEGPDISPCQIVNTNGAGDAFLGGFLHSALSGKKLGNALDIAQKCAIDVIQRPGAR